MAELDGANNLLRSYVWGGGELHLINGGGNTYQVGCDGNENVGTLIKASTGTVSASYDYDPFGQTVKLVGEYASPNPFRFSGQYTDVETSLIYYGYRYYDPQIGKWISRDPIGEEGGLNLYAFLRNDGLNTVDLLGLARRTQIKGGGLTYSCNCGWIDWGHARPTNAKSLWNNMVNGGQQSKTGQGFSVIFSETAGIPVPYVGGYIIDFPSAGAYFVRHNLSVQEEESVAQGIVKEVSEKLETGQRWTDRIMHSSFSEEDLVSNLIGFYRAVKGYSVADIETWCLVIKDESENYKIWDETGGTGKNRSWRPIYHKSNCCGDNPKWPSQLDSIHDVPKGSAPSGNGVPQPLWRDWIKGIDWEPRRKPCIGNRCG